MNPTTYHSDEKLKSAFLAEMSVHEQADALIKGSYGQLNGSFHGCGIGCSVFSLHRLQGKSDLDAAQQPGDHAKVARDLGLPLWLAYLEDNLFEQLPDKLSKTWPRRLAEAIPVGAVIEDTVLAKILVWSLMADTYGVIHTADNAEVKGWITTVADYITADSLGTVAADQREAAARAAWAAWAARGAWATRATRATWDAWDAWDAWAARAARAAWAAWGAWDAWGAFYPALSEYVLSELRALPVKAAA